jgi:hypothetical protein
VTLSPDWQQFFTDARSVEIVSAAERLGAKLKRSGSNEQVGPCPLGCAKTDGFVLDTKKQIFLCRPSGAAGDAIAMVMHCQGVNSTEAAEFLTGQNHPGRTGGDEPDNAAKAEARAKRQKQEAANARRAAVRERLDELKMIRDGEAIAEILGRAESFLGSHGERYLQKRGAPMTRSMARDLRYVDEIHYWGFADVETEEQTLIATVPALVAIIRSPDAGIAGIHITHLDPSSPVKWVAPCDLTLPKHLHRNPAKKMRKATRLAGGMIRLGPVTDTMVLGEGIETVGAYRARGFVDQDAGFGAAMSLQNLSGGCVASVDHPTLVGPNGKPTSIPNGIPDPAKPGVILPPHVKRVILLGDGDSDPIGTRAALQAAGLRYKREGREVFIDMAPDGFDFASMKVEEVQS